MRIFKRRHLLHTSIAVSTTLLLHRTERLSAQQNFLSDQQDYGVASGDPRPNSVVLWTRLPQYATTINNIEVTYTVSEKPDLSNPILVGTIFTSKVADYTVKVLVENLQPFTRYYYGFKTKTGYTSVIGRTLTAPAPEAKLDLLKFAYVSCQDFTAGYYPIYQNLARQDDIHFCVHLGDAIYETSSANYQNDQVRTDTIGGGEAKTLSEYREKYKLYLTDAAWREVRRNFPWIILWDDHEYFNNYAGAELTTADYDRQRAAYTAFLEYQPIWPVQALSPSNPPQVQVYRNFVFGSLMELFVLDERQYRSGPACQSDAFSVGCDTLNDPSRTMLGSPQKQWLKDGLANSKRQWKFILSEVMVQEFLLKDLNTMLSEFMRRIFPKTREASSGVYINLDAWDGYPAERRELLEFIGDRNIKDVVVCTGDIHNCYVGELRPDFQDLRQKSVGVEVVTGSVSSAGIAELAGGLNLTRLGRRILLRANPSMKYLDLYFHVFTQMVVTPSAVHISYEAVPTILKQRVPTFTLAKFTIPKGQSQFIG